jgi:hypothetical protein
MSPPARIPAWGTYKNLECITSNASEMDCEHFRPAVASEDAILKEYFVPIHDRFAPMIATPNNATSELEARTIGSRK